MFGVLDRVTGTDELPQNVLVLRRKDSGALQLADKFLAGLLAGHEAEAQFDVASYDEINTVVEVLDFAALDETLGREHVELGQGPLVCRDP